MFLKNLKKPYLSFLLVLLLIPNFIYAYSEYLVVGGQNIGIELKSKGIMVVGFYRVNDSYFAKDAGLKVGDVITAVNNKKVNKISEMITEINGSNGRSVLITYLRDNQTKTANLPINKDDSDTYKTGIYVKDNITGIGTLTFIDPNTKLFGALGHEITEKTTGKILDIKSGSIFQATVSSINRSEMGNPGEKNAKFFNNNILGSVAENTNKGIFGKYEAEIPNNKLYKVANPNEIKIGNARILTVLNEDLIEMYDIKITKILDNDQKTKNILFEITDEELIKKTGGIVQGMSGSPIIQGEYIIGAITHVVIDNPTKGYGIFITNMLEEAEN